MRKWVNSRRFIVCLFCLGIIAHQALFGTCDNTRIAESLVPVLVAFMGATTIEKATREFGEMRRRRKDEDEEEDDD